MATKTKDALTRYREQAKRRRDEKIRTEPWRKALPVTGLQGILPHEAYRELIGLMFDTLPARAIFESTGEFQVDVLREAGRQMTQRIHDFLEFWDVEDAAATIDPDAV